MGVDGKEAQSLGFLQYGEVREMRRSSKETELEQPERQADNQARDGPGSQEEGGSELETMIKCVQSW